MIYGATIFVAIAIVMESMTTSPPSLSFSLSLNLALVWQKLINAAVNKPKLLL